MKAAKRDANAERLRPIAIDENCQCGHLKSEHGEAHGFVKGHGGCLVNGCDCWKFSWKSNVYAKTLYAVRVEVIKHTEKYGYRNAGQQTRTQYLCTKLSTGNTITVKSAAKFRREVTTFELNNGLPSGLRGGA